MQSNTIIMGRITVRDLAMYSYHGCYAEEQKIGSEYKLDIWVEGDFSSAEKTDELTHAIDYVEISDIASEEMAVSSKLIEHVADRILSRILTKWQTIRSAGVVIKKISPPMNTFAQSVEYSLERRR